jgi:LysR family transcriptional regulator, glycine cleavage system transcriptional activator
MHAAMPPLSALRAFEAAARHLSLTQAARELSVTAGALSHQIRGLEDFLGVKLFERRVRSIALTTAGKQLYPGLQTGFGHIREAVASLDTSHAAHVLVVSTSPGLTSKWLAPRLYRFGAACPDIDVRISSSAANANFATDGVDLAVRNMPVNPSVDSALEIEELVVISYIPVCNPRLLEKYGPAKNPEALARLPLIHDESLSARGVSPSWSNWFKAAGVDKIDLRRGLRFNSSDHALDAAGEGAGVLLTHDLLAYDDLRTGRLVIPVKLALPSGRAFYLVWPKGRKPSEAMEAFRRWIKEEIAALDWSRIRARRAVRAGSGRGADA